VRQVDVETAVGYALKRATTALRAVMDAELREHQLSVPQYACLELLAQRPEISNAELARGAFVSRQAMYQLLGGLRASGLVASEGHGRRERFAITPAGEQRRAGASQAVARIQERMLAPLDADERARLHAHLTACADALSP
jgi:DNA-binding MarR family transcriptional regulator